jgi:hypothetical protein
VKKSKPRVTRDPQIAGDPYISGKEKYRVDLQQLLRLKIKYDVDKEHAESDRATDFLLYDNYFDKAFVTGTPGVNEENLLNGEEQLTLSNLTRERFDKGGRPLPQTSGGR